jgi:hypothetical protein
MDKKSAHSGKRFSGEEIFAEQIALMFDAAAQGGHSRR